MSTTQQQQTQLSPSKVLERELKRLSIDDDDPDDNFFMSDSEDDQTFIDINGDHPALPNNLVPDQVPIEAVPGKSTEVQNQVHSTVQNLVPDDGDELSVNDIIVVESFNEVQNQEPDNAVQNHVPDDGDELSVNDIIVVDSFNEVQNQASIGEIATPSISKKRKTPEPSLLENLLARKTKILSIIANIKAEIEANKARNEVLKVKQTSKEDTLASIKDEIVAQIEKSYTKKHRRLDGQDAKRQKREDLQQEYANRVNPKICDQLHNQG